MHDNVSGGANDCFSFCFSFPSLNAVAWSTELKIGDLILMLLESHANVQRRQNLSVLIMVDMRLPHR